jgi:hypothetical protein
MALRIDLQLLGPDGFAGANAGARHASDLPLLRTP